MSEARKPRCLSTRERPAFQQPCRQRAPEERQLVELGADRALQAAHGIASRCTLQPLRRRSAVPGRTSRNACRGVVGCAGRSGIASVRCRDHDRQRCASACARARAARFDHLVGEPLHFSERIICSCSTFSVRSRLVRPRWMNWRLASSENSSMRDFTSCSVNRRAVGDGGEVDEGFDALVVLDRLGRDGHAEVLLALHHRDPEISFEQHPAGCGPDVFHRWRGVAFGEDVRDRHGWRDEVGDLLDGVRRRGFGGGGGRWLFQRRGTPRISIAVALTTEKKRSWKIPNVQTPNKSKIPTGLYI